MAALHNNLAVFVSSLSLLLSCALGARVVCEQLPSELCAFAVSSTSRRCVLENTQRAGRATEYECRTSEVAVEDARLAGLVETDGCVRACGVERATVGISSDSLLDPRVAGKLCSPACFRGCPNIIDLYSNLAAAEGVVFSELCEAHRSNPRRAMTQLQSSGEATGVSAMGHLDVGAAPAPSPMVSPEA
ncbi:hypothetical protein PR202_gb00931 [Eleusine coracana subsp. coracana]|uniref:PAR1 protein n=1 Tax=Eleusine coracana subsp. coracana TaxID=191504 RepID=A0AAV5DUY9_ELECO|nr:hypothetical protein QOZ80_5BG0423690 [Eleusine coracana subsp. coracana]GJN14146.1 hypothetical protein PR202_gb00931 [Eleusine coracana subsp. coracana]